VAQSVAAAATAARAASSRFAHTGNLVIIVVGCHRDGHSAAATARLAAVADAATAHAGIDLLAGGLLCCGQLAVLLYL
jgi:hypothetical protein